ncbi:Or67d, partial [Drosophila busckii]
PVPESDKSCLADYCRIIYILRISARICGADVTDPNYRLNLVTYILFTFICNFFICTIYTMYRGVSNEGGYTVILQVICFVGPAVQGTVKLICFINYPETLRISQSFLHETYKQYEQREPHYVQALQQSIEVTRTFIRVIMYTYIAVVICLIGFPLVYYLIYKQRIFMMQFLLPGVDPYSSHGYLVLSCIQACSICFGGFGNFGSDMYVVIFIGNVSMIKNVLGCKLLDLNAQLDAGASRAEVVAAMRDIVRWHMEYLNMLTRMQLICFWIIVAMVGCSAVSILATMYCMLIGVWPAAPILLLFSFMNLYMYCGLGTMVDKANIECADVIYTQCHWYKLPVMEQRFILLMLRKAQNTSSLTVGSMLPLTVGTGLQLTKAVYSLVMLLMR